jgi:hypothetical protein
VPLKQAGRPADFRDRAKIEQLPWQSKTECRQNCPANHPVPCSHKRKPRKSPGGVFLIA